MDADDLCHLSAIELHALYTRRELSPVEVTRATLERIQEYDSGIRAFITLTPELALAQARTAETLYRQGESVPPLAGIPTSIKDLTPTRGVRTTRGSLLHKDWIPDFDAPIVERLYRAGIVMLGKTNTPEYGWKGDSGNRIVGPTHNPWKHGDTAGGSSGGAAAAVACGFGALAQGSDGAGSIRIPAALCGIYGLKPSWGLVPSYPASPLPLMSHLGPMTRTVADAALMLSVIAGADPRDRLSVPARVQASADPGDLSGLRVAFSPDLGYVAVEPEICDVVANAANRLEELGCQVEEVDPGIPDPWHDVVHILWASAFAALHGHELDDVRDRLDIGLAALIEEGMRLPAARLARAYIELGRYYDRWRVFMEDYDVLLTPTLPTLGFPAGADHPERLGDSPTSYLGWTPFTYPFNITGQPAASIPCGFSRAHTPIGLQIVGRWRADDTVLRVSAAFEAASPWRQHRPYLPSENKIEK